MAGKIKKTVRRKSDGKLVYRQHPPFEPGYGLKNAVALHGGVESDYEEIDADVDEWKVDNPTITPAMIAEEQMKSSPFMRAMVKRMARAEGKTPRQIMDEIKADV